VGCIGKNKERDKKKGVKIIEESSDGTCGGGKLKEIISYLVEEDLVVNLLFQLSF
jgi:hypothetical protein